MNRKKFIVVFLFCCMMSFLALGLVGCSDSDSLQRFQVTGNVIGAMDGKVMIDEQVSQLDQTLFTLQVSAGNHILKVLNANDAVVYQEAINISKDTIKNIDLVYLSLTDAEREDLEKARNRTLALQENWDQLQVTANANPKSLGEEPTFSLNSTGSIGSYGDILVTLDGTSSSLTWAGGHAGLVENYYNVIECFGNKGDLNGVRRWPNDWANRYNDVTGLRVYYATSSDYSAATTEGVSHLGKPYNYWFWNITTTSSFYCSQLVWRAWYNQGWDLNDGGAVWPVDLIESSDTYAFYTQ